MTIGVYGLGRFGAFWAGQLAKNFDVVAWSRNPERPSPAGVKRLSREEELFSVDTLILCMAISAIEEVLKRIAPKLKPGMLVMDTCSVKVHPSRLMLELLPPSVSILATHPMFGPDSGRKGLAGLPLVFSPLRMSLESITAWKEYFKGLGLELIEMSPAEHDREAAYTQGITHFIGRVLGQLNLKPSEIGTLGYKNLLDIVGQTCNDPWTLFVDLQQFNPYTTKMRDKLHEALDSMMEQFRSIEAL